LLRFRLFGGLYTLVEYYMGLLGDFCQVIARDVAYYSCSCSTSTYVVISLTFQLTY